MNSYPENLEIQFHNACNANCSICPYGAYAEATPLARMSKELKNKILADIQANSHRIRRVMPYLNNEPFLDKGFLDTLKWFKEHTPSIRIEVSTNLSAYREDHMRDIIGQSLIHDFRISFFGGSQETYQKMMPGLKYERSIENLRSFLRLRDEINPDFPYVIIMVLSPDIDLETEKEALRAQFHGVDLEFHFFGYLDRAGSNTQKNRKLLSGNEDETHLAGCSIRRNEHTLCLNIQGRVPLCSQDWFSRTNLGDVRIQSIEEIWNSRKKHELDSYINGEQAAPPGFICKDCKLAYVKTESGNVLNFQGDRYMDAAGNKQI